MRKNKNDDQRKLVPLKLSKVADSKLKRNENRSVSETFTATRTKSAPVQKLSWNTSLPWKQPPLLPKSTEIESSSNNRRQSLSRTTRNLRLRTNKRRKSVLELNISRTSSTSNGEDVLLEKLQNTVAEQKTIDDAFTSRKLIPNRNDFVVAVDERKHHFLLKDVFGDADSAEKENGEEILVPDSFENLR